MRISMEQNYVRCARCGEYRTLDSYSSIKSKYQRYEYNPVCKLCNSMNPLKYTWTKEEDERLLELSYLLTDEELEMIFKKDIEGIKDRVIKLNKKGNSTLKK